MAKKGLVGELTDEEILRVAKMRLTESSPQTYTQVSQDTQLSVERGVIWLIHFIEFDFEDLDLLVEVGANAFEFVKAQVTRENKTGIILGNDSDLIQRHQFSLARSAAIGTDAGPLYVQYNNIVRYDYPLPLPYASQNIFLGGVGKHAGSKHNINVRIGYTIKTVSEKFFFRVAQALLG